jgi:hypothetical protein
MKVLIVEFGPFAFLGFGIALLICEIVRCSGLTERARAALRDERRELLRATERDNEADWATRRVGVQERRARADLYPIRSVHGAPSGAPTLRMTETADPEGPAAGGEATPFTGGWA